jgi:hypothetical protein
MQIRNRRAGSEAPPLTRTPAAPDCKFIGLPGSMDYALTEPPPDDDIGWSGQRASAA